MRHSMHVLPLSDGDCSNTEEGRCSCGWKQMFQGTRLTAAAVALSAALGPAFFMRKDGGGGGRLCWAAGCLAATISGFWPMSPPVVPEDTKDPLKRLACMSFRLAPPNTPCSQHAPPEAFCKACCH